MRRLALIPLTLLATATIGCGTPPARPVAPTAGSPAGAPFVLYAADRDAAGRDTLDPHGQAAVDDLARWGAARNQVASLSAWSAHAAAVAHRTAAPAGSAPAGTVAVAR